MVVYVELSISGHAETRLMITVSYFASVVGP